ncbi:PAAR domain-containing protein [Acinetobacter rudis]|uniref:PAAR domain-containing protein n=1 Tax=Acinetobacter rudis CIP 110305 TaxID=421052 RepID=S3P6X6_9GAMM|nr:PAAR domain-containing protein [Acinetobacter rudis]EPF74631.1 hypothetical protein F945_01398 [Acinetobacter rudis CIP 110305]
MIPVGVDGSTTSHGGVVNATQTKTSTNGQAWLLEGDGFACPKCKIWSTLIRNNTTVSVSGRKAAIVGDKFTCGATLEGVQSSTFIGSTASSPSNDSSAIPINSSLSSAFVQNETEIHKIQFQVINEDTAEPITDILYEIYSKSDGRLLTQGYTDQNGMTTLYESDFSSEAIELITLDLSKPLPPLSQSNN